MYIYIDHLHVYNKRSKLRLNTNSSAKTLSVAYLDMHSKINTRAHNTTEPLYNVMISDEKTTQR